MSRKEKDEEGEWGLLFWNVAGLGNKDRDIWRELGSGKWW
jgi:hypothetical protein